MRNGSRNVFRHDFQVDLRFSFSSAFNRVAFPSLARRDETTRRLFHDSRKVLLIPRPGSPGYIGDNGAFAHDRTIGFTRRILQAAKVYFVCIILHVYGSGVDPPDAPDESDFRRRKEWRGRKDRYSVRLMGDRVDSRPSGKNFGAQVGRI